MNPSTKIYSLLLLSISFLFISCSKKNGGFVFKGTKNFKSYFNGYYHAERVFKNGTKTVEKNFKVPEEGTMPLFNLGDSKDNKASVSNFDEAIKKCDIIIFKHRVKKKNEELYPWIYKKNNWVDNSRLLIGKSNFYKENYTVAQLNFNHILEAFPKSDVRAETYLWLAKTQLFDGNKPGAKQTLDLLIKENLKLKRKDNAEMTLLYATLALEEGKVNETIALLEENIKSFKGRQAKAQVHYLLAQLYDQAKNFPLAYENYSKVIKLNPSQTMTFGAQISLARLSVKYQEGGGEGIDRSLKKMANDVKNEDFLDQIYYELAMLNLKNKEIQNAITNLKLGAYKSKSNNNQKALCYYKLGSIYFNEQKDYTNAQAYYDSAATLISDKSKYYDEVKTLSTTLKDYVKAKNSIQLQDSLLALSSLSDKELEAKVEEVIEAEKKRKEEEMRKKLNTSVEYMTDPNAKTFSGFPFDNIQQVASGKNEFTRFWGARSNEDNWRRKNKEQIADFGSEEDVKGTDDKNLSLKDKYIKNVPKTDSSKKEAHKIIANSYFALGQIYSQKFNQNDSALVYFNKLMNRYPTSDLLPKTYYALHTLYLSQNNTTEADKYKKLILEKYPTSDFAALLRKEKVVKTDLNPEFQNAFTALMNSYKENSFETMISMSDFILKKFGETDQSPQVYYIKGSGYGGLEQKDSLKSVFMYLVKKYPTEEVSIMAKKTLEFMNGGKPVFTDTTRKYEDIKNEPNKENLIGFSKTKAEKDQVYAILFVEQSKIPNNDQRVLISDFNRFKYSTSGLNPLTISYQGTHNMSYIASFPTFAKAYEYLEEMNKDPKFQKLIGSKFDETAFFMTSSNFKLAYSQKKMKDYIEFYKLNKAEMLKQK